MLKSFLNRTGHYRALCLILILSYLSQSVSASSHRLNVVADLVTSALVIGLFSLLRQSTRFELVSILVAIVCLGSLWIDSVISYPPAQALADSLTLLLLVLSLTAILRDILSRRRITSNDIFGCICAYLISGFIFALVFSVLAFLQPSAFRFQGTTEQNFSSFLYLSFINITTLGYGDILPSNELSRALCVLEAVYGQMYTAVVIAHLMGFHVNARLDRQKNNDLP